MYSTNPPPKLCVNSRADELINVGMTTDLEENIVKLRFKTNLVYILVVGSGVSKCTHTHIHMYTCIYKERKKKRKTLMNAFCDC